MRFPWQRRETRADSSYTDALIASITANAGGRQTAFPTATAALEACAGLVGRAFASAEVGGGALARAVLDAPLLAMIGRALMRRGEIVLLIRADMDGVRLLPCQSHDVDGGPDPRSWVYRCSIGGPEQTLTYDHVPAAGVIHLSYARDPERPWRGYGPLYSAALAGRLSANVAAALADEAGGPHGTILTLPVAGDDPSVASLHTDLANMKGSLHLLEGGNWDVEAGVKVGAGNMRIGAAPTAPLVELHARATMEVYAACGVPPAVFEIGPGTAGREAYRQVLFGLIAPLGRMIETELKAKLDDPAIALSWDELRAADIAGRARAFQSMVGAGMELSRAAALSGLMVPDDG